MSLVVITSVGREINTFISTHTTAYVSVYYYDNYESDITEKHMIMFFISCSLGIIVFLSIIRGIVIKIEKLRSEKKKAKEKVNIRSTFLEI